MIDPKDHENNITEDGFDFIEDEIFEDTFDENQNSELSDDDDISFPSQEMLALETEDVSRDDEGGASFPMQEMLALEAQVEAVIFASPKPIKVGELLEIIGGEDTGAKDIQLAVDRLMRFYEERGGGFKLENIRGGGYQFRTAKAAAPLMEKIFASRPRPISRAAQETLAIIAYRQPCTRADIEFIRGVDAGSIIKNLLERDLIKCVGRKDDAGRPMLFGTTAEFLQVYQLDTIKDLPPLDSFQPALDTIENANELIDGDREVDIAPFIDDSNILDEEDNLLIASEDNELQEDLVADEEKEDIENRAEQNIVNNESEEITSNQNITGAIFAESIDLNQQENEINITASEDDESFFTAPNDSRPAKTHFE